jgi:hypothetical protein
MADGTELAPVARTSGVPYSRQVGEAICVAIATTPRGLDFLCAMRSDFPDSHTVTKWLHEHAEFRAAYAQAKLDQADLIFDECLEIADDASGDRKTVTRNDGSEVEVIDQEFVARSKLRIDTRLRMAAKLSPKRYGDKLDLTAAVNFGRHEDMLDELR